MIGVLACAAWLVGYFLPWITFTPAQRETVREAFAPRIDALEATWPEHAARYRVLLAEATGKGALTGLDLHLYARAAHGLNLDLQGAPPPDRAAERPWVVQRMFRGVAVLLAFLPLASTLLLLVLVARRVRTGPLLLATLVVVGCLGGTLGIVWTRVAEALSADVLRGTGLALVLASSLAQACTGLFSVTRRTWWRVYGLALLGLALVATVTWAVVLRGWTP